MRSVQTTGLIPRILCHVQMLKSNKARISLKVDKAEKDLGILISSDTTWKDHIVMAVAKANKMLGFPAEK